MSLATFREPRTINWAVAATYVREALEVLRGSDARFPNILRSTLVLTRPRVQAATPQSTRAARNAGACAEGSMSQWPAPLENISFCPKSVRRGSDRDRNHVLLGAC